MPLWLFWVVAGIVLVIAEMLTVTFYLLWLGVGAFVAAGTAHFTDNVLIQILAGCVTAFVLTVFTRPLTRNVRHSAIGFYDPYENIVGKTGTVTQDIDVHQMGQVRVGSEIWSAVASGPIASGSKILVTARDSTILTVETLKEN